jgi:hypothetical protein
MTPNSFIICHDILSIVIIISAASLPWPTALDYLIEAGRLETWIINRLSLAGGAAI